MRPAKGYRNRVIGDQIDFGDWLTVIGLQLATIFLEFSTPAACWTLIGGGIRLAQDVGVHRLQNVGPDAKPTIESELWKRAFWMLVCMDRNVSSILGRPCTTQYEECVIMLPIADGFFSSFLFICPGSMPSSR